MKFDICPKCNNIMDFNASDKTYHCDYCDSKFAAETVKLYWLELGKVPEEKVVFT